MTEQTDPLKLSGAQLLALMVAGERRNRQSRDAGSTEALAPFPACAVCDGSVERQTVTLGLVDVDERVLTVWQCGHRMSYNLKVAQQMVSRVQQIVDDQEKEDTSVSVWGTIFDLEEDPPYAYQRSHILPSEDGLRVDADLAVQLAQIPSHITRDGRDDQPSDGAPWPWLRVSLNTEDVVLHARQVREVYESMGAWLEQVEPEVPLQLTAAEARQEVDRLGTELYWAQDAHGFVGEMCDVVEVKQKVGLGQGEVSTEQVRLWLKGPRCARLIAAGASNAPTARGSSAQGEDDALRVLHELRLQVRSGLEASGRSQASVARELQVSTKHLCEMLSGKAVLTIGWAARILRACGMRLTVVGPGKEGR